MIFDRDVSIESVSNPLNNSPAWSGIMITVFEVPGNTEAVSIRLPSLWKLFPSKPKWWWSNLSPSPYICQTTLSPRHIRKPFSVPNERPFIARLEKKTYQLNNRQVAVEGICDQRSVWSDCADAQADLSLRWSHKSYWRFCRALAHIWF